MTGIELLNIAMRLAHILGAIALVGSAAFIAIALIPAGKKSETPDADSLVSLATRRFVPIVHASVALLLISGFYNFYLNLDAYAAAKIHAVIGTKSLFGLIVLALTFVAFSKHIKNPALWLKIHLALSVIVIILGAVTRHLRLDVMQLPAG